MTTLLHNKAPVSAVLFDMDNTLFDFIKAQLAACQAVIGHVGFCCDAEDLFSYFRRQVHGFEHHGNIRDFLLDHDAFTVRLFAECCAMYETVKVTAVMPYPGIESVLKSLYANNIPLAVVTDAQSGNATKRLEKAGLSHFFTTIVTPEFSGAVKPDPASFLLALEHLGTGAEQTVLVGDSIRRDIEPAQKLGMMTVYAKYGDRYSSERDFACVPDYTADSVTEVGKVLAGLTGL